MSLDVLEKWYNVHAKNNLVLKSNSVNFTTAKESVIKWREALDKIVDSTLLSLKK
jgi:hypothetical protein